MSCPAIVCSWMRPFRFVKHLSNMSKVDKITPCGRESISLYEREMIALLIIFFNLYLCGLSVYLCFSVPLYLRHGLIPVLLV